MQAVAKQMEWMIVCVVSNFRNMCQLSMLAIFPVDFKKEGNIIDDVSPRISRRSTEIDTVPRSSMTCWFTPYRLAVDWRWFFYPIFNVRALLTLDWPRHFLMYVDDPEICCCYILNLLISRATRELCWVSYECAGLGNSSYFVLDLPYLVSWFSSIRCVILIFLFF
jgi:hypothetical protein